MSAGRLGHIALRSLILSGGVIAAIAIAPLPAASQTATATAAVGSSADDYAPHSVLGNYLAGRIARGTFDVERSSDFLDIALKLAPEDPTLLAQAFETHVIAGRFSEAERLAPVILKTSPDSQLARYVLALADFRAGRFDAADERFKSSGGGPAAELIATLSRAWCLQAKGDVPGAFAVLDQGKGGELQQSFFRYHRGLIADLAGRTGEARASFEKVMKGADRRPVWLTLAIARNAARSGDTKAAIAALRQHIDRSQGDPHPSLTALLSDIEHGDRIEPYVKTSSEGMAEVYYGLGELFAGEGGLAPATQNLQLALYLVPNHAFALVSLANIHETAKQYELANQAYERVPPGGPLDTAINIRRGMNLNAMERVDDAKALLDEVARRAPTDLRPLDALGSIMRSHKRYEEAITYYNRAITLITKPDARHWQYFYSRGTSYERIKKWPQAEADLQVALKLSPEQPLILNYLGYSWVDQNKNLKQGMALIEKAVRLKPDDGYIVDSLGWAHYRLGNFREAVRWLERAVELRPEDPVLNDHLGDAFWRVGREREARFQWEQSLTLKPEPEDAAKTRRKLELGLPALAQPKSTKQPRQANRPEFQRKRTEAAPPAPSGPSIQ
ncbi:MAG: tetratricopeptide repeat protein [Hyphomicrobiales bacterium]|nr:tetratricopeptide repeat protein [Hyphomicrobiales bacterium]